MIQNKYRLTYPIERPTVHKSAVFKDAVKQCYKEFKQINGMESGLFGVTDMSTGIEHQFKVINKKLSKVKSRSQKGGSNDSNNDVNLTVDSPSNYIKTMDELNNQVKNMENTANQIIGNLDQTKNDNKISQTNGFNKQVTLAQSQPLTQSSAQSSAQIQPQSSAQIQPQSSAQIHPQSPVGLTNQVIIGSGWENRSSPIRVEIVHDTQLPYKDQSKDQSKNQSKDQSKNQSTIKPISVPKTEEKSNNNNKHSYNVDVFNELTNIEYPRQLPIKKDTPNTANTINNDIKQKTQEVNKQNHKSKSESTSSPSVIYFSDCKSTDKPKLKSKDNQEQKPDWCIFM